MATRKRTTTPPELGDLTGKTVLLKASAFKPGFEDNAATPFRCTFGNGCFPNSLGSKVFGMFANGNEGVTRREYIDRVIADDPRIARMVEISEAAGKEYDDAQRAKYAPNGGSYPINFSERDAFQQQKVTEFMQADAMAELLLGVYDGAARTGTAAN